MSELTQEEKRVKIAEACGWKCVENTEYKGAFAWTDPNGRYAGSYYVPEMPEGRYGVPNYFASLDACAEMRKVLTVEQQVTYEKALMDEVAPTSHFKGPIGYSHICYQCINATPAQHCEAFAKSFNPPLW